MHVPDSADIGGGGLYTVGPPKSVIGRHILNALVQEVLEVLNKAGITPRGSGTADAAASYKGQLRDSILRLGHSYKDFVSVPADGTGLDTTFNKDILAYRIDPDSGGDTAGRHVILPSSINSIFGSVAGTQGYVILITNNTPSYKALEDSVRHVNFTILPGQAILMFGWNDTGTRIVWCPLSSESGIIKGTETIGFQFADSTFSVNFDCAYSIRDGIVNIELPPVLHAIVTGGTWVTMTVPAALSSYTSDAFPAAVLSDTPGAYRMTVATWLSATVAQITLGNSAAFGSGGLLPQSIRYRSSIFPLSP